MPSRCCNTRSPATCGNSPSAKWSTRAMCYEHGGMIDDGTLFRLGDNNFRWIGGDDYGGIWLREHR